MRFIAAIFFVAFLIVSCSKDNEAQKPLFMTSSYPVYSLVKEIAGDAVDVDYIVPTGASPHTYLPKPSDIKAASSALALFYIAENFDGWITKFPAEKKVRLIDMLPMDEIIFFSCGHDHSTDDSHHHHDHEIDPHFWLDPLSVAAMLDELTSTMISLYPKAEKDFKENAKNFKSSLTEIHSELSEILQPVEDAKLFLHHPSFNYLIERYGLYYAGAIEESPGKEPSPKFIADLVNNIKNSGVKAIFSEPQLNGKTVQVIAKEAGVQVFELNPEGNSENMKTYREILLNNAGIIRKALE